MHTPKSPEYTGKSVISNEYKSVFGSDSRKRF